MFTSHHRFYTSPDIYLKPTEVYTRNKELRSGRLLHGHLVVNGLARLTHFASKLIAFYTACGKIADARKLFDKIPKTNIRRWIVLIGAYARYGFYKQAMEVFCEMQMTGLSLNVFVLPSILKACSHLSDTKTGEKLHTVILKYAFESDAFANSALIDMYGKSGRVEKSRRVFDMMMEKDLVALNAVISGYAQQGFPEEALNLVEKMKLEKGLKPNLITWNTLVTGFSLKGDETMVSEIFKQMSSNGVEPDVVSWTSVITGYVQNFQNDKAFNTFKKMLRERFHPTSATLCSFLPACSAVANLRRGKAIHGFAFITGVEEDVFVRTALVDMYTKCGFIHEAWTLFCMISERNSVTWNSMIFGYANHGYCNEAIELFNQMMKEEEEKLDHLTFTAVLVACSHAGMIELGQTLFHLMQEKYKIVPRLEHYACMVDLLGRAGKLDEAYDMINRMPMQPDLFVWGALLGACRNHGNIDLAEEAAKHLSELEPGSAGNNLLLSNLYADSGSWGNVVRLKKMIKKRKVKKLPGCSWIEAN